MMRCLVTGGCGFVGSALVRLLLARSCEVVVVDDLSRGSLANFGPDPAARVRVVEQDVTGSLDRIFASFQPQAVFHLAALHFIPDCDADPARCLRVNVDGTRSVLQAAAGLRGPVSLVLASSAAVYAPAERPLRSSRTPSDRSTSTGSPSAGPRSWRPVSRPAPGRGWESPGSSTSSARARPTRISSPA